MFGALRNQFQAYAHRQSSFVRSWATRPLATASKAERALGHHEVLDPQTSKRSLFFFGAPIVVTFSLGVWQVRRLRWKIRLIEEREKRLGSEPMQAAELFETKQDLEYRRVRVSGRFLHGHEKLVGPRSAPKDLPTPVLQWGGSSGLQVITPFQLETGEVILINRGWVPQRLVTPAKRPLANVSALPFLTRVTDSTPLAMYGDGESGDTGVKTFTGIVRACDERNRFTPENNPDTNDWYYVDAEAMTQSMGFRRSDARRAIVVELLEPLPKYGWPYPRAFDEYMQFRTPPSTHITYASTWFCLSAALAVLTRHRLKHSVRARG